MTGTPRKTTEEKIEKGSKVHKIESGKWEMGRICPRSRRKERRCWNFPVLLQFAFERITSGALRLKETQRATLQTQIYRYEKENL